MSAYRRKDWNNRWCYKRTIKLPDATKKTIRGVGYVNTKASAEKAQADHIERLLNPPAPEAKKVQTVREFSEIFMSQHAVKNKLSERKKKEQVFRRYIVPVLGELPIDGVGKGNIDEMVAGMLDGTLTKKKGGVSKKSINNSLAVLSKMLNYAVEIGTIRADQKPIKVGIFKTEQPPIEFLEFDEYAALLDAASDDPFWHLAILLGADAGLRRGEIRAMEWKHWDKRNNRIRVEQAFWEDTLGTTKNSKSRTIPLTERLGRALHDARHLKLKGGKWLLPGPDGTHLTREAMRWHLPRLCRKAEIGERQWHPLRHTFCTHLAQRGAPVRTIQELAGHRDIQTTLRYMHLVKGAKEDAINLLDRRVPNTSREESADKKSQPT
ncbi:MAG: site-specific integrase, partial [Myxococcales bacterium]|nr:site-specific integrase [Myxococcales bacterium]